MPGRTHHPESSDSDPYEKLASVYDWVFGLPLQSGRAAAMRRLALRPGDAVLEVGVGTGLNAPLYPPECSVIGVDVCAPMLHRAARRLATRRIRNVRLMQMDASRLSFDDDSFDVVYAPYLVTAVHDPVQVGREMRRVCAPDGRVVVLNHFLSGHPVSWVERRLTPLGLHCGFRADLDMDQFLDQAGLDPIRVERVNFPPLWSLVICRKSAAPRVAQSPVALHLLGM